MVSPGEDWQAELRARGYRMTPQRQLVLDAIRALEHATPEDVYAHLRQASPGVNLSTVYRTLELLEEIGMASHTHLDHGAPTYHSHDKPEHVHLVCRSCKTVQEVAPKLVGSLVDTLRDKRGFETDVAHLTVFGICEECTQ